MLKKVDFKMLFGALCGYGVGVLTIMGITQKYIYFAGIDNEMGFTILSFMVGTFMLMCLKK